LDLISRRGTLDLILATRFGMDGAGALPTRWRRWASSRGGAMERARRRSLSHATVHYLGQGFFLQGRWSLGNSPGGSSADVVHRSRVRGSEARALIFGDGGGKHQGAAHNEAGQNGCGVSCRSPTLGCWSLRSFSHGAAMERGYLGLASVFHEISAWGSSIYRGFGSMILCVRRTLSPSHLGFGCDWISLGFSVGEESSVRRRCSA
jgi:hypothetical protein